MASEPTKTQEVTMSDGDAQLDKIAGAAKEAAGKVTGDKDL